MANAGASQYTFHVEATNNIMDCIQRVKAANMKVGDSLVCRTDMFLIPCFFTCTTNQTVFLAMRHSYSNVCCTFS